MRKESGAKSAEGKKDHSFGRPKIKLDDFDKAAPSHFVLNLYTKANPEIPFVTQTLTEVLLIPGVSKFLVRVKSM